MKNKKRTLIIIASVLLAICAVGGTIAWLTKTSSITNSFTVGEFSEPSTEPTDRTLPISKPDNLDGNLYEPSWENNTKIYPGAIISKDPYVGIGPGSEDGIVYVYVDNSFSNKVYFTINNGWTAVAGETTAGYANGTYTSGIFKYTAGLTGDDDNDVWTSAPLFNNIVVDNDANTADIDNNDMTIIVKSFIHQTETGETDANILAAAKTAFGIN